jgi:hypothetical protein
LGLVEPKPQQRWQQLGFVVLELVLPFVASWLAARRLRPPTAQELDDLIRGYEVLLQGAPYLVDEADSLVEADFQRSASLEAKAVAILQGIAVLAAVLVGVEVVTWAYLINYQRLCLVISDAYGTVALYQAIHASRPKVIYVYTESDIEEQAKSAVPTKSVIRRFMTWSDERDHVYSAARRMAYVRANRAARGRLSNQVEATLGSTRNAVIVALLSLAPFALNWLPELFRWIRSL